MQLTHSQHESRCSSSRNISGAFSHSIAAVPFQGFKDGQISTERFLNLRYDGTDVAVMTPCPEAGADPAAAFEAQVLHSCRIPSSFSLMNTVVCGRQLLNRLA